MKQTKQIIAAGIISGAFVLTAPPSMAQDIPERPSPERTIPEKIAPPAGNQQRGTSNLSPQDLNNAKEALRAKGLNPGPMDGTWDTASQQALREFQQANQLPATGTLDPKTAEKLGVMLGSQKGAPNGSGDIQIQPKGSESQMPKGNGGAKGLER